MDTHREAAPRTSGLPTASAPLSPIPVDALLTLASPAVHGVLDNLKASVDAAFAAGKLVPAMGSKMKVLPKAYQGLSDDDKVVVRRLIDHYGNEKLRPQPVAAQELDLSVEDLAVRQMLAEDVASPTDSHGALNRETPADGMRPVPAHGKESVKPDVMPSDQAATEALARFWASRKKSSSK